MRLAILLFFLCVYSASPLFAQSIELAIPSGELPSDVSSWENDPALMHLSFSSPEAIKFSNAHIVFEVTEGIEHILLSTRAKFSEQPAFKGSFKKKNFKFTDVIGSSITVDPSLKPDSSSIGKLQGGTYSICFYLVDSSGQQIASVAQGCTSFNVRDIDSPQLLTPANESVYDLKTPLTFTWTSANVLSQTIHYKLKLFPIYEGQTPEQAMASTSAFYASDDIFSTSFVYPADAPPINSFPKAKGITWVVTQMDQDGKPIGKNYGRSLPSIFYRRGEGK